MKYLLSIVALLLLSGCGEQAATPGGTTSSPSSPSVAATNVVKRSDFSLPDLDGTIRHMHEWDGKVVMLNFWAPWCPPCKKEIPDFMALQDNYADQGFVVVGVTVDTHENAELFADSVGINYPILIAEEEGIELGKLYGNRVGALPFTVFIDREGHLGASFRTEVSYEDAEQALLPLL